MHALIVLDPANRRATRNSRRTHSREVLISQVGDSIRSHRSMRDANTSWFVPVELR